MAIEIRKMKEKQEFALINISFSELLIIKDALLAAQKTNDKAQKIYQRLEELMNEVAI